MPSVQRIPGHTVSVLPGRPGRDHEAWRRQGRLGHEVHDVPGHPWTGAEVRWFGGATVPPHNKHKSTKHRGPSDPHSGPFLGNVLLRRIAVHVIMKRRHFHFSAWPLWGCGGAQAAKEGLKGLAVGVVGMDSWRVEVLPLACRLERTRPNTPQYAPRDSDLQKCHACIVPCWHPYHNLVLKSTWTVGDLDWSTFYPLSTSPIFHDEVVKPLTVCNW